ncbi:MAG TPA: 2-C-methyl-D-erythritol 2,4-cyclodiphosphate synthase [Actinomycetota bacterium]|nr:2-C-methyl-D-erythritol 2,4-cyclodiphosphate synthase [Actinomycetota bacterium]
MRVGTGLDVHPFVPEGPARDGRALVLGGVSIEGAPPLQGWSDADVVAHAVADALLGAAHLGDLGTHFPPSKVPRGGSSLDLLAEVGRLIRDAGWRIGNVDCVVVAQAVRISPYRERMEQLLSGALAAPGAVSVKATTTDRLGFLGRGEGIAATAVALLEPAVP